MKNHLLSLLLALPCLAPAQTCAGATLPPLFDNGKSTWQVVIPKDAHPCLQYAAEEFTNAIARVSGVQLPVVTSDATVRHAVRITSDDETWAKEKVAYAVKGTDLILSGNQPRAALHATYCFLDRELGVRWLWPGEDGAFFPPRKKYTPASDTAFAHEPRIWFRGYHHCGDWRGRNDFLVWQSRNYCNVHRHGNTKNEIKYGQYSMLSLHNANLNGEKELFAEHPECFALLHNHRSMVNICFCSDLGAQRVAERISRDISGRLKRGSPMDIVSLFPNDNQDYCECEKCRAKGISTAWFQYFNKVVALLKKDHPDVRFATIAYQGYLAVPDCSFSNLAFIEYASHSRCHIHKWDDTTSEANVKELARFKQWCARTDVKIGHYAYEYDAISGHPIFMPFFSMIGDAVEKAVEMNLVTQIPEVGLSPKNGPDVKAQAIQNRLTILYYARKMWQPDLTLDAFLDDMCKYAYGKAAKPMKDYFLLMDDAWSKMPGRIGLFADGMNVSANLLKDEKVRARSAELLAEAERLAADDDPRMQRNVTREKALYAQWLDYRDLRLGNSVSFKLPKVDDGAKLARGAAPQTALLLPTPATSPSSSSCCRTLAVPTAPATSPDNGRARSPSAPSPVKISGFWTPKKELVFAFAGASEGEVALTDTYAEHYVFSFKNGKQSQKRVSDVGIEMTTWAPAWTATPSAKALIIRIPLSCFGHAPTSKESWDARFVSGAAAYPLRDDVTVKLAFLAAPAAERPIVHFAGDKRLFNNIPALRVSAESDGWTLIPSTNAAEFAANVAKADSYYLQVPQGKDFAPETAAIIRERVKNGGTLLARSWSTIPLQKILGDETVSCKCEMPKDGPLSERFAKYVREGDWCKKPWDFDRSLRNWYAPCYMMVPKTPEGAWIEYASRPSAKDESRLIPYISAMKYGKGCIIIVGETCHISHFWLIDNIRRDLGL